MIRMMICLQEYTGLGLQRNYINTTEDGSPENRTTPEEWG